METEKQIVERLIRQGSPKEELFKKYPKHIDHITNYRLLIYDKPIYFDVDQIVKAVRRFGVYARSEEEAIERVKVLDYVSMDIEILEADEPYVIDADEAETKE